MPVISDLLTVFVCGFAQVFMMGFQSRNVNTLNYKWAAASSFAIGLSSLFLWKIVPEAGLVGGLVYGVSGATAITSSMYIHERFIKQDGRGP